LVATRSRPQDSRLKARFSDCPSINPPGKSGSFSTPGPVASQLRGLPLVRCGSFGRATVTTLENIAPAPREHARRSCIRVGVGSEVLAFRLHYKGHQEPRNEPHTDVIVRAISAASYFVRLNFRRIAGASPILRKHTVRSERRRRNGK
jgi:hypothetical protein